MYCKYCGTDLSDSPSFCTGCGAQTSTTKENPSVTHQARAGYSVLINDPAFARYIKASNGWSAIFSVILALIAIIGFSIAGEMGIDNMENPQALFIGLGVGGMFLCIAFFQILGRKRSKTWDGVVIDKTIKKKDRRQSSGKDDYYIVRYTEYAVVVQDQKGKTHRIAAEDDDTHYNYYQIGDNLRHHAGLNSYEKYDKSKDSIVFCNACATLCNISDDYCFRCKCPLLK